MNRKRDRSPSPSRPPSLSPAGPPSLSPSGSGDKWTKVCLICEAIPHEDVKSCYYVFVLDSAKASADAETDCRSSPNREPTLRIDGLDRVTFCVFESTLYIFECEIKSSVEKYKSDMPLVDFSLQSIEEEDYDMDAIARFSLRKSAYSLDLLQFDSPSKIIVVQKNELHKLPDMHGVKVVADAALTAGGKILVFSTIISTDVYYYPDLIASFELYDPHTNEWLKLPEVAQAQEYEEHLRIREAGFLSSSTFLISGANESFVFDLDKNENGRQRWRLLSSDFQRERKLSRLITLLFF